MQQQEMDWGKGMECLVRLGVASCVCRLLRASLLQKLLRSKSSHLADPSNNYYYKGKKDICSLSFASLSVLFYLPS